MTDADDLAAPAAATSDRETLVARGRLGLGIILGATLLFALTDLRLSAELRPSAWAIRAVQLAAALGAWWLVGRLHSRAAILRLVLAMVGVTTALTALSGALHGDLVTTTILCLAVAWGTVTLIPLGARAQSGIVAVSALSMLCAAWLQRGDLVELMTANASPALATALALGASIALAYEYERQRVLLAGERRVRRTAEAAVRRARDELEQRADERTAELEAANRRLEEAGASVRASEHRFRMVSALTSDFAYCARVEPHRTPVLEWFTAGGLTHALGFTAADIAAQGGGLGLVHPDDLAAVTARLETMIATGRADVREFRIVGKDGSTRWIREHGRPEWDAAHTRVERIYGAAQDVTDRRQAEEALAEQERFVSAILETVSALVSVIDRDGRIIRLNRACAQTIEVPVAEAQGRLFWDLLPAGDVRQRAQAMFAAMVASAAPTAMEMDWITPTGARRRLTWSTTFLRDDSGAVAHLIATGIDITARREAERALRRSEEHWRALIEHSTDLIGILGADATIRYLSPATRQLIGEDPGALVGRSALSLIHPDDVTSVVSALQAGLEHRDTGEALIFRIRHHDGSWRMVEGVDNNLLGIPAVDGIVVNLRDITERRAAEEALAILNQDLERRVRERTAQLAAANRDLESFSYSVSHDLRTPLRHMLQFAAALAEDCAATLDPTGQRHVHRILAAGRRAEQLVDALLDLAQLGRADVHRTTVDLSRLAQEVVDELRRADPARHVVAVIASGMVVDADRRLLRIVVDNLLGNAWKYTARHPRARIEVGLFERDGEPVYFVRDDGAGFDMEHAGRLFMPFQRLHPDSEFAGTGIGLATVQRIIQRHDGRVWAEAAIERGACVYFTLGVPRAGRRIRERSGHSHPADRDA